MTTLPNHTPSVNRRTLRVQVQRQHDHVQDLNGAVDAARRAIDWSVGQLREAVREGDAAIVHLTHLLEWAEDVAA